MAMIDEGFQKELYAHPEREYRAIVRTQAAATPLADECASQGMKVHYRYRMLPGMALTARGKELLALARHPEVLSIEPDERLHLHSSEH